MELSTQCPVCGKNLEGSLDATTTHVNMCMDNKQSLDTIGDIFTEEITSAALDGKRNFKYCPICYKLTGVNAKHIKSCGRLKGIDTRELIRMCEIEPPEATKETNNKSSKATKSKVTKSKATKKVKDSPFGPGCIKEIDDDPKKSLNQPKTKQPPELLFQIMNPRNQVEKKGKESNARKRKTRDVSPKRGKVHHNQYILQSRTSDFIMKLAKPIGISNGELTKLSIQEKKECIKNRIALVMSTIVCPNNFVSTCYQNELPYSWTLSSLNNNDINFVVDGFEKFCPESQEFSDKNETPPYIENHHVKEPDREKANTKDFYANMSTDSLSPISFLCVKKHLNV